MFRFLADWYDEMDHQRSRIDKTWPRVIGLSCNEWQSVHLFYNSMSSNSAGLSHTKAIDRSGGDLNWSWEIRFQSWGDQLWLKAVWFSQTESLTTEVHLLVKQDDDFLILLKIHNRYKLLGNVVVDGAALNDYTSCTSQGAQCEQLLWRRIWNRHRVTTSWHRHTILSGNESNAGHARC